MAAPGDPEPAAAEQDDSEPRLFFQVLPIRLCLLIPAKSKRTCSIPAAHDLDALSGRGVPMPTSSASRRVLSQVSNGGVPRSAIGSKFISGHAHGVRRHPVSCGDDHKQSPDSQRRFLVPHPRPLAPPVIRPEPTMARSIGLVRRDSNRGAGERGMPPSAVTPGPSRGAVRAGASAPV